MKVQVISKEIIKPSTPTSSHPASFKLSYLDQLAPADFVCIILFYIRDNNDTEWRSGEQNCNLLKESLSKCLATFYPLAGRINENAPEIVCNDAGVDFLEARVMDSNLSEVLVNSNQDCTTLNQFLPCSFRNEVTCNTPLLAIQVNAFDCGGMALGICIAHKIADASSISTFLKAWSSISATNSTVIKPYFNLASLFPMKEYLAGSPGNYEIMKQEKIVTKRFVFNASSISSIKHEMSLAANENTSASSFIPTRVETVFSFLIKRLMHLNRANKIGCHDDKPVTALYAVNLRKRRVPPVPEESFGNMSSVVVVPIISDAMDNVDRKYTGNMIDMATLAAKIRAAVCQVDQEYLEKLENDGDWYVNSVWQPSIKSLEEETGLVVLCSSWCGFGFYEIADFGWGKPIWFGISTMTVKNTIVLLDTKSGDGIEAWVGLVEEEMVEFERDQKLLACVSSSE